MKRNPVVWFEIYVHDMSRAKTFYEAVFQGVFTPMTNPDPEAFPGMEMWAFPASMEAYGAPGALVKMAGYAPGGSPVLYFSCDNCAIEAGRAASYGGKVVSGKVSIGEFGFIAMVSDTEGNVIGLHSMQ